jgi:hypothetical protein
VPVIKNGVPVDTPEVQHARAAHYAAIAKAGGHSTGHESYAHDYSHDEHHDLRYDGKYGYHYPTIKNGVPVDTPEVQHARAEHFAKVAAAPVSHGPEDDGQYKGDHDDGHYEGHHEEHHDQKYDGKYGYHYPTIKNGVPVDTPEVQHARAAHLAKVAAAPQHYDYHHHAKRSADFYDGKYGYHYPTIKNGVPVEPVEVQHARAAHLAKVGTHSGDNYAHDYSHHAHADVKYDGKYGYHYPTIKNGVPVEPEAVQHARAEHLAKVAHSGAHHGVVYDTPEVQHAKAQHYAAVAAAYAHAPHSDDNDDGSWHEKKYL